MLLYGNKFCDIIFGSANGGFIEGFSCISVEGNTPIFAGSKTLSKSKAINSMRYIKNKLDREPLTFTLSFIKNNDNEEWTWQDIDYLYRIFDVTDYTKLYLFDGSAAQSNVNLTMSDYYCEDETIKGGIQTTTVRNGVITGESGYRAYYNVIPHIGSRADLMINAQNKGYVDITFETDAGNAWVDMEVTFSVDETSMATPWYLPLPNITNVRNSEGNYRVYPYVKVEMTEGCNFASFTSKIYEDKLIEENTDGWLNINLFNIDTTNRRNFIVEIDGENRQYKLSYEELQSDDSYKRVEGDPSDVWDLTRLDNEGDLRFLFLEPNETQIYHRIYQHSEAINYPYSVTIKVAMPVNIGGLLYDEQQ